MMVINTSNSHYFTTNDGVYLHYLEKGKGQPLVLLPSWNISCQIFKYQLESLSHQYRVLALDMRGHGLSEKVSHGYTTCRFAYDLHDFIEHLHLTKVILLGHTFGAGVICSYLELFNSSSIDKLILIDRTAVPIINSNWNQEDIKNYGPTADDKAIYKLCGLISQTENDYYMEVFFHTLVNNLTNNDKKQLILENSNTLPKKAAASLLHDTFYQDWRNVFPAIDRPTLVVGGQASLISASSQLWTSKQIPNAKLIIFEESEGGKHYPFIENPKKFNQIVDQFIRGA